MFATLRSVGAPAARPIPLPGGPLADTRRLEVASPLAVLLPEQGLRRGGVLSISGSTGGTSLLLALLARALSEGSWAAVVGLPSLGAEAAAGLGVPLERLALVPFPGPDWPEVVGALLDALDVVALVPPGRCRPSEARRLAARARQRGAVLLLRDDRGAPWPESADLSLEVATARWSGLGAGHGSLVRREVTVRSQGRRAGGRVRAAHLLLPSPTGGLASRLGPRG